MNITEFKHQNLHANLDLTDCLSFYKHYHYIVLYKCYANYALVLACIY